MSAVYQTFLTHSHWKYIDYAILETECRIYFLYIHILIKFQWLIVILVNYIDNFMFIIYFKILPVGSILLIAYFNSNMLWSATKSMDVTLYQIQLILLQNKTYAFLQIMLIKVIIIILFIIN